MLGNLFGGGDDNMLLIIILLFVILGGDGLFGGDGCHDRDRDCDCKDGFLGGLFGGDNIIWILILFLILGDVF